jgi:multisubunit Na+/H+ antiporter MnhE subunit
MMMIIIIIINLLIGSGLLAPTYLLKINIFIKIIIIIIIVITASDIKITNTLLKKRHKGREDEEGEDVNSYWNTFKNSKDTGF